MNKLLIIFTFFLLSSCAFIPVHKMDIEQGNIMTQEDVSRLHTGMSEAQVRQVMGTPVLLNTFNDNRVDYIYVFRPGRGAVTEKQLVLTFQRGVLKEIR